VEFALRNLRESRNLVQSAKVHRAAELFSGTNIYLL